MRARSDKLMPQRANTPSDYYRSEAPYKPGVRKPLLPTEQPMSEYNAPPISNNPSSLLRPIIKNNLRQIKETEGDSSVFQPQISPE